MVPFRRCPLADVTFMLLGMCLTKRPPAAGEMLPVSRLPLRSREERVDERMDAGDSHSAGRAPVAQHSIRAQGSGRQAAKHRH